MLLRFIISQIPLFFLSFSSHFLECCHLKLHFCTTLRNLCDVYVTLRTQNKHTHTNTQSIAASVQIGQVVANVEFIDLDYGTYDGCFR